MRPRWAWILEAAAVAAFAALAGAVALRLGRSPWDVGVPAGALAGYLAADLASGLTHWFCDSFYQEDSPLIGRLLIQPFREHHRDPAGMTRHGFLELSGNSALGLLPVLGVGLLWGRAAGVDAFLLAFALALFLTNHFHKWAHQERVPAWIAALQRARLILRPEAHAVHHRPPHRGAYGVTNGWANVLLDRVLR